MINFSNNLSPILQDKLLYPPLTKKELSTSRHKIQDSQKIYKNVDMDHVYIDFEKPINKWMEGAHIVNEVPIIFI